MSNTKLSVLAIILIVVGALILGAVFLGAGFDFTKLNTTDFETNEYEITDTVEHILITTDTTNVVFLKSDNGKTRVVCYERVNSKHSVEVTNGTLTVSEKDDRSWYEYVSINFSSPELIIYLPDNLFVNLNINASTSDITLSSNLSFDNVDITVGTGDVCLEGINASTLKVSTSTGDISLSDLTVKSGLSVTVSTGDFEGKNIICQDLTTVGVTGDVELENTRISGELIIERSTGDVELVASDADSITIKTSSGDVECELLSDKTFSTHTISGSVFVPSGTRGGKCEVTTSSGDIKIKIKK